MSRKIFVKGSLHVSGKIFTACEVRIPEDVSEKDAAHIVKVGGATYVGELPLEENEVEETETETETETTPVGDASNSNEDEFVDDLTAINGVGEKTEAELIASGYDSFEKISNANVSELSDLKTISKKEAAKFIAEAKEIVKS